MYGFWFLLPHLRIERVAQRVTQKVKDNHRAAKSGNALIPVVTVIGTLLCGLVSGVVITEMVSFPSPCLLLSLEPASSHPCLKKRDDA